jgi:hypothetical protein
MKLILARLLLLLLNMWLMYMGSMQAGDAQLPMSSYCWRVLLQLQQRRHCGEKPLQARLLATPVA